MDLDAENVVILGQGNVALDVARILLTPISILKVCTTSQVSLTCNKYFVTILYFVSNFKVYSIEMCDYL